MGNRKKTKRSWLRLAASNGILNPEVFPAGVAENIPIPGDEKVIVKEVPAKVDGVVVGIGQIYEDGTVGIIIDDDAPQWAKDKIQAEVDMLGYSIGTD